MERKQKCVTKKIFERKEVVLHVNIATIFQIKGADGSIVAIINIHRKRGEGQKYTLTFMEEGKFAAVNVNSVKKYI